MRKDLMIYIDPGFLENVGHYRNLATSIRHEADRRGVDLWHFVKKDVSDEAAETYQVERIFDYRAFLVEDAKYTMPRVIPEYSPAGEITANAVDAVASRLSPLREYLADRGKKPGPAPTEDETILESFATTLERILDRLIEKRYTDEKISLYMYTSSPLYFVQVARVLGRRKFRRFDISAHLYLFYLNLDFCLGNPYPAYERMLRSSSRILESCDPRRRISLYADSERTISLYGPYYKRRINIAPISIFTDTEPRGSHLPAGKKLVIGFFGYTHVKQGYQLIKELYDRLIVRPEYGHVSFVVRHNLHWLTDEMQRLVDDFRTKDERITHLIGDLPKNEYEAAIDSCDIILIPHSKAWYPCQTSGLFVDSLRKGKVVVVPEDTWLADQLESYGSGKTFRSDSIDSFTEAVAEVIDNFPRYQKGTVRNIGTFTRYHTVESLFNLMGVRKGLLPALAGLLLPLLGTLGCGPDLPDFGLDALLGGLESIPW